MQQNTDVPQLFRGLSDPDIVYNIGAQINTANYLLPPADMPVELDRTYDSNAAVWQDVIDDRLRATVTLKLRNFLMSEWFPRSPGLFYTREAEDSREQAMQYRLTAPLKSELHDIDDAQSDNDPDRDFMYIFDPYGKLSMLKGGIGSIRLRDKEVRQGYVWFMSVSSTPVAHEGFPIALPDHLYQRYIDEIITTGYLPCTVVGKLQLLPRDLSALFRDYTGVPQLYLLVEEVQPNTTPKFSLDEPFRTSAAVTFSSTYEGYPRMYAAYVTFYPGKKHSLQDRIEWLQETYVEGMYRGRIITDFDEQTRHFQYADFSLEKVMSNEVGTDEVDALSDIWPFWDVDSVRRHVAQLRHVHLRSAIASSPQEGVFSGYLSGLKHLLDQLDAQDPHYLDALTLEQRLTENIKSAERYGDTETLRAERTRIIESLNVLSLDTFGKPFNDLHT